MQAAQRSATVRIALAGPPIVLGMSLSTLLDSLAANMLRARSATPSPPSASCDAVTTPRLQQQALSLGLTLLQLTVCYIPVYFSTVLALYPLFCELTRRRSKKVRCCAPIRLLH
jgi:hypothetical protein